MSYNYVTDTGVIIPDTSTTRDEVAQEYKGIFGDDFITDSGTPEGDLIDGETTARTNVATNNAQLANQINPNIAGGTFLDAIWALTAGGRDEATSSTVQCTVTGVSGTTIPAGSRAQDDDGNIWRAASEIVIPVAGTISASFYAEETGPIAAAVNTITTIVDAILGWETIDNTTTATLGVDTQSDISARRARKEQLGLQGRSTAVAVTSNLSAVTGVSSWAFRENVENTTQTIDGLVLVAHSIRAVVRGGTDAAVGAALLEAKSAGCNWNGTTSVTVTEEASGQEFTVSFDRPDEVAVLVRVTVRATAGTDPSTQVVDAVLNYANGESEVGDGFTTGNDVSPFEISAAVNVETPGTYVSNCEVAYVPDSGSPNYVNTTIDIALDEIATINSAAITVVLA